MATKQVCFVCMLMVWPDDDSSSQCSHCKVNEPISIDVQNPVKTLTEIPQTCRKTGCRQTLERERDTQWLFVISSWSFFYWLNWFSICYLSVPVLDGFVLSVKHVDRPLMVILQWCSHHQLPEPIPVHVGYLGESWTQPGVLRVFRNIQRPLQDEWCLAGEHLV